MLRARARALAIVVVGGHANARERLPLDSGHDYSSYVGDFDADGCHDIAWFDAVGDMLLVWRCLPGHSSRWA